MKLGELKGAIRKAKGNPSMTLLAPSGASRNMNLVVQKTVLLEELTAIFPNERSYETGMDFDPDTGVISCPSVDLGGAFGSVTRVEDGEHSYIEVKDSAGNVRLRIGNWPQEGEILDVVGLHNDSDAAEKPSDPEGEVDPQEDALGLDLGAELESLDDIDLGDDDIDLGEDLGEINLDDD